MELLKPDLKAIVWLAVGFLVVPKIIKTVRR
jgi:hypothetical protein